MSYVLYPRQNHYFSYSKQNKSTTLYFCFSQCSPNTQSAHYEKHRSAQQHRNQDITDGDCCFTDSRSVGFPRSNCISHFLLRFLHIPYSTGGDIILHDTVHRNKRARAIRPALACPCLGSRWLHKTIVPVHRRIHHRFHKGSSRVDCRIVSGWDIRSIGITQKCRNIIKHTLNKLLFRFPPPQKLYQI